MNPLVALGLGAAGLLVLAGGRRRAGNATKVSPIESFPAGPKTPAGWRDHINKNGLDYAERCKEDGYVTEEDVSRCLAELLFPNHEWPPPGDASDWQKDAWSIIVQVARTSLGLDPAIP